ncbi:unnamed protein product [Arabidopsis arenosa]|uniref:Uncharacterized protein n=1 Tax=Arabidopsis arenosa TaxID=38785 RepID=A0A8S1ZGG7_ARAAE|nr:unnamed protein product [Arabidopsis arenosa]
MTNRSSSDFGAIKFRITCHEAAITVFLLSISYLPGAFSEFDKECKPESDNTCTNKNRAFDLKLVAIFSILTASLVGVCLPFFARSVSAFQPKKSLFFIVKSFASESSSPLVSSIHDVCSGNSVFSRSSRNEPCADVASAETPDQEMGRLQAHAQHGHGLNLNLSDDKELGSSLQFLRYRVIAIVRATNNTCTIKGLIAALSFHQMFEGMGLGGCILQAKYGQVKKAVMAFFFAVTMISGVVLEMALSKTYKENSPNSLITVGLLNASSGGLLIYTALVDLLAADFMGQKMQLAEH